MLVYFAVICLSIGPADVECKVFNANSLASCTQFLEQSRRIASKVAAEHGEAYFIKGQCYSHAVDISR